MIEVKGEKRKINIAKNNPSIQRIDSRCIDCGLCFKICENVVGIDHNLEKKEPLCINCGQCIMNCPVGALCTKYDYKKVLNLIKDSSKKVAVSIAPAVRVSLAEEFGIDVGTNLENILPTILRKVGFDYVFDITFGADVTIMEEASELLERLKNNMNLPMFTSCCPSWVKYASIFHPELLPNISSTKSPIGIQSTLIKTYFKEMNQIEEEIVSVVIAPCTAKKYEILKGDTDYIITVQELALMIREFGTDIKSLSNSDFDLLLSKGSRAGLRFGRSGGVMEAVLNTFYYFVNKKNPPKDYFKIEVKEGINRYSYKVGSYIINVAVIYGMKNLEEFLYEIDDYDFVEVMNCTGGCIGGGGNPLAKISELDEVRKKRCESLNLDLTKAIYSHQNKEVKDLYRCFLDRPLSNKAVELVHTKHDDLSVFLKKNKNSNV